jgi:hypothetical protein
MCPGTSQDLKTRGAPGAPRVILVVLIAVVVPPPSLLLLSVPGRIAVVGVLPKVSWS